MSERDEFEAWASLTDAIPEVGQLVIVKSDGWSIPKVLRYLDKPYPRLSDPDAGRWYWYPERMRWAPVAPQAVPALTDGHALRWATQLAQSLHRKHYTDEAPQWEVLPDIGGVISQIDNMTVGLIRDTVARDLMDDAALPFVGLSVTLVKALKRLSFAAQTTGGVAGLDEELVAAIAEAELALKAASGKIAAPQPSPEPEKAEKLLLAACRRAAMALAHASERMPQYNADYQAVSDAIAAYVAAEPKESR